MDYETLIGLINEDIDGRFELILDYDDFNVYEDHLTHKSYFVEVGENDADLCYEVECIARLKYNIAHDITIPEDFYMAELFDCSCCGEQVTDDAIYYLWYERV